MAIRLIEGKIGSGKTYYAVRHVFLSYYKWDDVLDEWKVKEEYPHLCIYTNIQDMKIGEDLLQVMADNGGVHKFFHIDFQRQFCKNRNVIYIIDEAQTGKFFPRRFKDEDVLEFFQRCRQLGSDVYLITQDVKSICPEMRELPEYFIRAVRRTNSVGNMFVYKFYSGDECFRTKRVKKDQKIFGMYTSMVLGETERIKSVPFKYIIIFTLLIVGAGLIFRYGFIHILHKMNSKHVNKVEAVEVSEVVPEKTVAVEMVSNDDLYKIIGIVDNHYIVKTHKGLRRVKIIDLDNKRIGDLIKIEKL